MRGKAQRSHELVAAAREILAEIQPASVRAVCYRLFTLGLIRSMAKNETNRVSRQLTDAREAGIIPWHWIVDETRAAEQVATWADPEAFLHVVERSYRQDRWARQPVRVEVWSEKGTVRGTLAPVLHSYGVTFRVMHGYASATAVKDAADTAAADASRPLRVLYVGDWDPSGLHMSEEDLPHRLWEHRSRLVADQVFVPDWNGAVNVHESVRLIRVALTADDVRDPELPSFDAETKRQDPRWRWFTRQYGQRCWELDALNPVVLRDRVAAYIEAEINAEQWNRDGLAETAERESIGRVLTLWRAGAAR